MATIGNCKAMHISQKIRCIQWDNCEKAFAYNTQYTPLNIKIHLSDSGNFEDIDWKVLKSSNDFIILIYCFYAICFKALSSQEAEEILTDNKVWNIDLQREKA